MDVDASELLQLKSVGQQTGSDLVLTLSPGPTVPVPHHSPLTPVPASPCPLLTTFLLVFPQKRPDQHDPQLLNRLRKRRLDLADRGELPSSIIFAPANDLWRFCDSHNPAAAAASLAHVLLFPLLPVCLRPLHLRLLLSFFVPCERLIVFSLREPPSRHRVSTRCLCGTKRRGSPCYMI